MRRKAYIFSGLSSLLLIGLATLTVLDASPFPEDIGFAFHVVLVGAVFLPPLVMGGKGEKQNEEVFSSFADITEPGNPSFEFAVPSFEKYRKIKLAPVRLAITLSVYLLLILIAAGSAISEMVNNDVPFGLVEGVAWTSVGLTASIIVLYILATSRELRYRKKFEVEVSAGLNTNGYKPVITFDPEDTSDRKLLMTDGRDHYWWWSLTFADGKALVEWEDSKAESPKTGMVPVVELNAMNPITLSGESGNAA